MVQPHRRLLLVLIICTCSPHVFHLVPQSILWRRRCVLFSVYLCLAKQLLYIYYHLSLGERACEWNCDAIYLLQPSSPTVQTTNAVSNNEHQLEIIARIVLRTRTGFHRQTIASSRSLRTNFDVLFCVAWAGVLKR